MTPAKSRFGHAGRARGGIVEGAQSVRAQARPRQGAGPGHQGGHARDRRRGRRRPGHGGGHLHERGHAPHRKGPVRAGDAHAQRPARDRRRFGKGRFRRRAIHAGVGGHPEWRPVRDLRHRRHLPCGPRGCPGHRGREERCLRLRQDHREARGGRGQSPLRAHPHGDAPRRHSPRPHRPPRTSARRRKGRPARPVDSHEDPPT